MGININSASDWEEDHLFANAMMTARDWRKISDGEASANVDANGWPSEDAQVVVWADLDHTQGAYTLSYEGSSNVVISGVGLNNKTVNGSKVSYTFNLTATGKTFLGLKFTNTGNGVRNVKIMRPKTLGGTTPYSEDVMFTDQIKTLISKFHAIRSMDLTATNGNICKTWAERVQPNYYRNSYDQSGYGWQGRGIAWEYVIQLANETQKDLWICVPVMADNNYIVQLATLMKNNLNSNLKLYIEYSNEVWNTWGVFWTQWNYNHKSALAALNAGNSSLNYDNKPASEYNCADGNCGYVFDGRQYGEKVVQISKVFRSVFGDAQMMSRIRPVLEGQLAVSNQYGQAMLYINQVYGKVNQWNSVARPVNYYVYGGGGSAYYNPDNNSTSLTIDNIWSSASYLTSNFSNGNKTDVDRCVAFGLKRIAYEGGPSMDKSGHSENIKEQAWGDPRMKTLLVDHHKAWNQYGGDILFYFTATGDYQWGFTHNIFDLNTPKLNAIDELRNSTKDAISYGEVPPVSWDGHNYKFWEGKSGWLGNPASGNAHLESNGPYLTAYVFRVTTAGNYNVKFDYTGASSNCKVDIRVDGGLPVASETITGNGSTLSVTLNNLQPGLHGIIIEVSSGDFYLSKVYVNPGNGQKSSLTNDNEEISKTENLFMVYPNPVEDYLTISITNPSEDCRYIISDLQGRILKSNNINSNVEQIEISELKQGIYIIKVQNNGKTFNQKIIKK